MLDKQCIMHIQRESEMLSTLISNLPTELQIHIYVYDPTYKVFNTEQFKQEIEGGLFMLNSSNAKAVGVIKHTLNVLKNMNSTWYGVCSYMQYGDWMYNEDELYEWQEVDDNYRIKTTIKGNILLFKLVPYIGTIYNGIDDDKYDGIVRRDWKVELFMDTE